jgi:hypothetical protein
MRIEQVPNPKHYRTEVWIDFVRDTLPKDQAAKMQQHLDEGCLKCSRLSAVWKQVWRTAQDEAKFRPPEDLVRAVQASSAQNLPNPRVRLLFDSWREPLPALIRSAATAGRHLIYQVGPVLLDLQTHQAEGGRKISVVGQLMSRSREKKGLGNAPVRLTAGERPIAETVTNQFGEFHLEFAVEETEAVRLKAVIAAGDDIDIPFEFAKA